MDKEDAKQAFYDYDLTEALKNNEPYDIISEIADNNVDIYNSDLLNWIGQGDNYFLLEDSLREYDFPKDSEGKPDFLQAIRQAQYYANVQVLNEAWEEVKQDLIAGKLINP